MLKESTELFTTSVQNHLQQLSGNKILNTQRNLFFALALTLGVSSCTPKVGVLKSPDYTAAAVSSSAEKVVDQKDIAEKSGKNKFDQRNIALLLPFKLNEVVGETVSTQDIKRSALALDFYQGFELGLEELAQKGANFNLDVLDTRDNAKFVSTLATSKNLDKASLVVGPVYPQEIKSFGLAFSDKEVLQINPLSAAMPTEFNLSNLVSITPPIKAHANAIANRVAKDYSAGNIIIIYNTTDSDSRQFLTGMLATVKKANPSATVVSVSSLAQLNENLRANSANYIIAGTTDKIQLKSLIDNLTSKYLENYYAINLFGHPLWDRYDFSGYREFSNLNPVITTESGLKTWSRAVRTFKEDYNSSFGVNPSDASYKGYDAAIYFGNLVNKYGAGNIAKKLTTEPYNGIYSSYRFKYNEAWGYANEAVFYKVYTSGSFQLQ